MPATWPRNRTVVTTGTRAGARKGCANSRVTRPISCPTRLVPPAAGCRAVRVANSTGCAAINNTGMTSSNARTSIDHTHNSVDAYALRNPFVHHRYPTSPKANAAIRPVGQCAPVATSRRQRARYQLNATAANTTVGQFTRHRVNTVTPVNAGNILIATALPPGLILRRREWWTRSRAG
jgi:hypothetical protein